MSRLGLLLILAALFASSAASSFASTPKVRATPRSLAAAIRDDLANYLRARGTPEHISAASASVNFADGRIVDVSAGTTSYGGTTPVTPANLFQIGSNTKAFTAVLMLKLQAEGKLTVRQRIGDWLPQYPRWKDIQIFHLLDMTSGIATYDNTRPMEDAYVANPYHFFSAKQLIAYVVDAPLGKGWIYSNTGLELCQLIAEKATHSDYESLVRSKVIGPANLHSTYYYPNIYPADLRARTVSGYYYDTSSAAGGLHAIVGRNVRDDSLSWTQAAGGIVATPHDLTLWARQLYQGPILTAAERAQMETLVSTATGKPISEVDAADPRAFGLSVSRLYKPGLGTFWFYEGETLGYRMVHAYFPKDNLVIAVGVNSQPVADKDKIGDLVASIYKTVASHTP